MKIWAHRGASAYAPENTLEAFELARAMGADGVELDVHLSSDGEIVVIHDDVVDRVSNGSGPVSAHTLAELKALDFSYQFPKYAGARIPTLAEVFALLQDSGMEINVELKTEGDRYEGIERRCVALAADMGMTDRVIYSSFNHNSLDRVKAIDPSLPTGLLYGKPIENVVAYAKARRANALHPYFPLLYEEGLLASALAAGLLVHPWTVNEPEDMRRLRALGATALITNKPDVVAEA